MRRQSPAFDLLNGWRTTLTRPSLVALSALAAAALLHWTAAVHAAGGSCLPRPLTPAEQQAGERVAARLRPLLPPAPPGWRIDGPDATDIASGKCIDPKTHKPVPQPVSVQVRRTFRRDGPPPAVPAAAPQPTPSPTAPDPQARARAKELELQIAELKRKQQATTEAYQAARRAGDSEAQRRAIAESREIRAAMGAPSQELMEIRRAEHRQRQADAARLTETAVAQQQRSLANRRIAGVAINTNSGRALARASKVTSIPGVPFAITQPGFSTSLLFGAGWIHRRHEAWRPWDPSASTSRVQDVNVRVDGPEEAMQALIGALDLKALDAVIER